jgi:5-methyltetrahydrofolate--homocysteine methyltransferase
LEDQFDKIAKAVIEGDVASMRSLTQRTLDGGASAGDILAKGLVRGMDHVGAEFRKGDMFIPEVLLSARTMQASMDVIRPMLIASGAKMAGKVVLGTVQGDLHDIGKNLVGMMMEGAGFEVIDLGFNADPEKFVQAVKDNRPDILGMSALLTTTMKSMQVTMEALKAAGVRDGVKVMIGGAPVTAEFARQIGADAYAPNASGAADIARQLTS